MCDVLLVDDEPVVLRGMAAVLEICGVTPHTAESREQALDHLRGGLDPVAIIADFRLRNGETGIQVIEQGRQLLGKAVPGLIITGDTAPDLVARFSECGVPVLHKPVGLAELLTKLDDLIGDRCHGLKLTA